MAWKVFIFPFRPRVWTALLLFAITCTIGLWTFHQYQQFEGNLEGVSPSCTSWSNLTRMAKLLLAVMGSCLGRAPPQSLVRSASKSGLPGNLSLRTATFLAFFSGTVVWSVYRASLTSELVVQIPLLPFDSLQGLLESNYQ